MVVIVMGVSGAGKSTIGRTLAETLRWEFYEGDELHPRSNIEKLRRGTPLTDEDRRPWLLALQELIQQRLRAGRNVVLACSALRSRYRDMLLVDKSRMHLVYLKGSLAVLRERLLQRGKHFMHPELLESQFATLEEPHEGTTPPAAIIVDITESPEAITEKIRAAIRR